MDIWLPKSHLSISQIKLLNTCPRKYYYNYIEGLWTQSPYLIAGGAAHAALEQNYLHKMETGRDMDVQEVLKLFEKEFNDNKGQIEDWSNKTEEEFIQMGRAMLAAHMKNLSGNIKPVSIEKEIWLEFDGIPVLGYIDVETDDAILDHKFKFSARDPLKDYDPDNDMQLTLYAFATDKKEVGFNLHWFEVRKFEDKDEKGKIRRDKNGRPIIIEKLWPRAEVFKSSRNKDDFKKLHDTVVSAAYTIDEYKKNGDFPKIDQRKCPFWCEFKEMCWGKREETDRRVWETLVLGNEMKSQETDNVRDKLDDILSPEENNDIELPF